MRFAFVHQHRTRWPIQVICHVLQVSTSGYYAWKSRGESKQAKRRRKIGKLIQIVFAESRQTYGSPRVQRELVDRGYACSVNFVAKLMRSLDIRVKSRRKFTVTTDSRHSLPVAENLLGRQFRPQGPNQVWLSDITYVPTGEGWLYLATVEDLYSRRIVGWEMSSKIDRHLVASALQRAIARRDPASGLMVHSDRGSQYCSDDYQRLLAQHQIRCSMSGKGNCWDNAPMESFYRTLKVECTHRQDYANRGEARRNIAEFIEVFYNRRRRHSTIGYVSPAQYEAAA